MHAPPIDSQLETEAAATPLGPQLAWLQRLLAWQVACTRQRFGALADDPQRGLYITDAEIDLLAADAPDTPADLACARAELEQERHALEPATRASALGRLAQLFGLSRFERDTLLLALAPELGLAFERMIGYVHDDVTRRRPSVGLALRLLCDSPAELAAARRSFAPDAPLLRHQLIQLADSCWPPLRPIRRPIWPARAPSWRSSATRSNRPPAPARSAGWPSCSA